MSAESFGARADRLIQKRCRVMDLMPKPVPSCAQGRFYKAESVWLAGCGELGLRVRFTNVLLKILCYFRTETDWGGWCEDPSPEFAAGAVKTLMKDRSGAFNLLLTEKNILVVFSSDSLSVSVYNARGRARRLLKKIARSEGLTWSKAGK